MIFQSLIRYEMMKWKKSFFRVCWFFIAMRFLPSESDSSRKQPCIPTPYHYCFVYKKTQYKLSKLKIKNLFLLHISQEKTHYNCIPSNRQIEIITVSWAGICFTREKMIAAEHSTIHMQLLPLRSINEPQLAVEAALTFFSVQKTNLRQWERLTPL